VGGIELMLLKDQIAVSELDLSHATSGPKSLLVYDGYLSAEIMVDGHAVPCTIEPHQHKGIDRLRFHLPGEVERGAPTKALLPYRAVDIMIREQPFLPIYGAGPPIEESQRQPGVQYYANHEGTYNKVLTKDELGQIVTSRERLEELAAGPESEVARQAKNFLKFIDQHKGCSLNEIRLALTTHFLVNGTGDTLNHVLSGYVARPYGVTLPDYVTFDIGGDCDNLCFLDKSVIDKTDPPNVLSSWVTLADPIGRPGVAHALVCVAVRDYNGQIQHLTYDATCSTYTLRLPPRATVPYIISSMWPML
jgi:hypothetical protein